MPSRLTPTELDHAEKLYTAGKSFDEVATELGRRNSEGVRLALQRRGVVARPKAGRPAHNRLVAPTDLLDVFATGESVLTMSRRYGVSRGVVRRWLEEAGAEPRSSSDANRIRMAKLTADERRANTTAANTAIRRMPARPDDWQESIARGRERVEYGGRTSPGTEYLSSKLTEREIDHVREKAIGRYNVDIAISSANVAVEVLGGNWHGSKPIHARRTPYILNEGWHLLFIWDVKRCQVDAGALDYLITYLEFTSRNPTAGREYRVIRGDGKLIATGRSDDDEFPLVPPSVADLH
jgi:very-short-patch-repair endonuclease